MFSILPNRLVCLTALILFGSVFLSYGQITGPTTPCPGINTDYVFTNGNVYTGTSWLITNGTVVTTWSSGANYFATVQWTSPGTGSLSFKWKSVLATLNVTLTVPSTPSGAFTYSGNCYLHASGETTTITRTGTPPSGTTWYWQTSSNGTSTSIGSGSTFDAAANSTYFLRAFNGTCWSSSSLAAAQIPPVVSTITDGLGCINTAIVISASASGSPPLKWYNACNGGTYLGTGASYTTPPLSASTPYYVSVYNSTTGAVGPRKIVTAIVSAPSGPPTALEDTNQSTTQFTANWTLVTGGVTYRLDVFTDQNLTTYLTGYNDLSVSGSSQVVSGLLPGRKYYYRVQAVKVTTITCISVESGSIEAITLPGIPTNFSTIVKSSSILAQWDAVIGADSYRIDVSKSSTFDAGQFVGSYQDFSVATNSLEIAGLTEHIPYYYRVRALNTSGTGGNSIIVFGANLDKNYVRTITPSVPFAETNVNALISSTDPSEKGVTTTFSDGLGREAQVVVWKGSPSLMDIVMPRAYDKFGRISSSYLPYSDGQDGWIKSNFVPKDHAGYASSISPQYQFYHDPTVTDVARTAAPFVETIFEASPLNRVLKKGGAGENWQPDMVNFDNTTDHSTKFVYGFNDASDNVYNWIYSPPTGTDDFGLISLGTAQYFNPQELKKRTTKDENQNLAWEFVDKEGNVILVRTQINSSTFANTYYVYDKRGMLACVLSPEGTGRINSEYLPSNDANRKLFLSRWAFQYRFDESRRLVVKQLPGVDPVMLVYDKFDRLVLMQEGELRLSNKWWFFKYDAF